VQAASTGALVLVLVVCRCDEGAETSRGVTAVVSVVPAVAGVALAVVVVVGQEEYSISERTRMDSAV
jgi:hypothetical protein